MIRYLNDPNHVATCTAVLSQKKARAHALNILDIRRWRTIVAVCRRVCEPTPSLQNKNNGLMCAADADVAARVAL